MPRIRWVIVYAVTSFIMAVSIVTVLREIGRVERLSGELDKRMDELVVMTRKTQELREKIEYYSSPAGMASLARELFNMVSPGEKMYRIEIVSDDLLPKN